MEIVGGRRFLLVENLNVAIVLLQKRLGHVGLNKQSRRHLLFGALVEVTHTRTLTSTF